MERLRTARMERINAELIEAAKAATGITEDCRTWSDWWDAGYLVRCEEKERPLFKIAVYPKYPVHGEKHPMDHFGRSQVIPGGPFKARGEV